MPPKKFASFDAIYAISGSHEMRRACIIGGSGQIGISIATRLCAEGWNVVSVNRSAPTIKGPWQHVEVDISKPNALQDVVKNEFDLLISCIAFDGSDARELLKVQCSTGRIIVISSASVYQDNLGRTLDEAKDCGFPQFKGPITEKTLTVDAGPETYSTRKIQMENELLENASVPITILRPCAIHGPYSKHAREWWFVKRLLDGRKKIPLAYGGLSQFQTTSVAAIADAVVQVLGGHLPSIINVADSDSPTVEDIGRTIMQVLDINAELVPLPDEAYPPIKGKTPWSAKNPYVCASAIDTGSTYAKSAPSAINWLVEATRNCDWQMLLPQLAGYPYDHFDYRIDDEALL